MTINEFSDEFDVYLSRYKVSLDEYEKSVLLTEAQEQVVRELYTGGSFEKTEELRRSLDGLIQTKTLTPIDSKNELEGSIIFKLPDYLWFITYESAILDDPKAGCLNGKEIQVTPMTQDEWHKSSRNPFRGPSKRRVIRLDSGSSFVELISGYNIGTYIVRYLTRPTPIILVNLENGLKINDKDKKMGCSLNSVIHRVILERAVQLALNRIPQTEK